MTVPRFPSLAVLALLLLPAGAPAQSLPAPVPSATPAPTLTPFVPPISFSLPTPAATAPVPSPTPVATPTPAATAPVRRALSARATPTPRATAAASRAAPTPTPSPSATATTIAPLPLPVPSASAAPAPVRTTASSNPPRSGMPLWLIAAAMLGGAAVLVLSLLLRQRRTVAGEDELPVAPDAPPAPLSEPAIPAPRMLVRTPTEPAVAPGERARLAVTVHARRAGVNLLTATADVDIRVRNIGERTARAIRIDAQLLSARAGQDDELGRRYAEPQGKLAVPAFALEAGTERTVRTLVTLPRSAINVITASERPMFVPVVAVNVLYDTGSAEPGQTSRAFAIGVERAGAAKLAPIWLDAPARMHEAVEARPHGLAIER